MYNIINQAEVIVRGMAIEVPAGQKLYSVMPGDTVRVKAAVDYRGPALDDAFYAAIGEWRGVTWPIDIGFFDEHWDSGLIPVHFDLSYDWVPYILEADIDITKIAKLPWTPGWFDLYAKLNGVKEYTPRLDNIIEILLVGEFQDFGITGYEKI